jgi:mannose-6-phosphate isomerase-like protein (cupin superfamily)
VSAGRGECRVVRLKDGGLEGLEQTVLECAPRGRTARATGEAEEVLFVVAGHGELRLDGERHALEPETGVNLGRGEEYELHNEGSDPLRTVCVRVRAPATRGGGVPARTVIRRLADQEAQRATTERWYRIVADPSTGLRSATHFVGYVPTEPAPEHFHTYDEVIYVLDGEGAFHAGGEDTPLRAGSTIELPARTVHRLENTGPDVMRLVAVFAPAGSPAAAYHPDGTPAYPGTPQLTTTDL